MVRASSPSTTTYAENHIGEERSGFFSVVDSAAPLIPTTRRFDNGPMSHRFDMTPGPGQYSAEVAEDRPKLAKGGTIGRANRFTRLREQGKEDDFLSNRYHTSTPGPASYVTTGENHTLAKCASFGRAVRHGFRVQEAATGSHVGPGSYSPDMPIVEQGSFTRSKRTASGYSSGIGPGGYDSFSSFAGKVKGGSFGRAPRLSPIKGNMNGAPGVGAYNIDRSADSKGVTFTRATRGPAISGASQLLRQPTGAPGPGAYTPLYAATSGNMKLK
ncbi:hypothetical protein DIPPA_05996 [Diplonema papillatum]|nr:hypothetical protein DIPPA_05996 [Diplonema papillatum]